MDLGVIFKLSLYGLTALVGIILGSAEGEDYIAGASRLPMPLPYFSVPLVIGGYLLTECFRKNNTEGQGLGLSAIWANTLGFIALAATAYEFAGVNKEGKLLAGTHLLLYATWIVLFQQKTIRLYWFLMALGVLQLAVASVLTNKGWFGFSAMGYMICAVWTLSVFSLWRADRLFESDQGLASKGNETSIETSDAASWALFQQFSQVHSTVQHEEGTHWLTYRFVSGVLFTSLAALFMSALFFAFIPRVWLLPEFTFQDDQSLFTPKAAKTGLATTVKLGAIGPALESVEPVFEIQISHLRTMETISVQEYAERLGMTEPLFRGAVLIDYKSGRWTGDTEGGDSTGLNSSGPGGGLFPQMNSNNYLQDIRMEFTGSQVLYCLGPPNQMRSLRSTKKRNMSSRTSDKPSFGRYNEITGMTYRNENNEDSRDLEYQVASFLPSTQQTYYKLRSRRQPTPQSYLTKSTSVPEGLKRLKSLAEKVIKEEVVRRQVAEQTPQPRQLTNLEKASALEWHLRESGTYSYTLDLSILDTKIDPVEDFLFNRKEGHCEYFATALALMIRTVGIPARVVSGYKGGVPHPEKKNALLVQQRFSHLWVEAWLDNNDGWTTFDATPAASRSLSIADFDSRTTSVWQGVQTTLSGLWSDSILNLSLARQEESLYGPIREVAISLWGIAQEFFSSPEAAMQSLWSLVSNRDQMLGLGGLLFIMLTTLICMAAIWIMRRGAGWCRRIWQFFTNRQQHRRHRLVVFYQRFVNLMRSRNMVRQPSQTQSEFADQVTSACFDELKNGGLTSTPHEISQLFYRVRFGNDDLSITEVSRVEQILTELERALSKESQNGGPRNGSHPKPTRSNPSSPVSQSH